MNIFLCRAICVLFSTPLPIGNSGAVMSQCCYTAGQSITDHNLPGRGGRAVDRAGLENRKAERPREFESHPLRSCFAPSALRRIGKIARSRMPSEALAKEGGR